MKRLVRRWLGIDTWGHDIYRIKRRLSIHEQNLLAGSKSRLRLAQAGQHLCDVTEDIANRLQVAEEKVEVLGDLVHKLCERVVPEEYEQATAEVDAMLEREARAEAA